MAEEKYSYEKLGENGKMETAGEYTIDHDGSITGHIVVNVKAWFDENPEERKRLGWIKHLHPDPKLIGYDPQQEYLTVTVTQVDEYTVTDTYHIMRKTEQMLALEEILDSLGVFHENGPQGDVYETVGGLHFF